jgi:hypothetical protein
MLTEQDTGNDSLLAGNPEESDFQPFFAQFGTNLNPTTTSWADIMEEAEEADLATTQISRFSTDQYDNCEDFTSFMYDKDSFAQKEHEVTEAILMNELFHKILRKAVSGSTPLQQLVLIKSVIRKIKDEWCIPNIYTTEEMIASHEGCISYYIWRNLQHS